MTEKVKLPQRNPDILEIVQITDCHIFSGHEERFVDIDTAASLGRVIDRINIAEVPDVVLVTGDLVHDGQASAYQRLLVLLKCLKSSVYCLPGNHDVPALMHRYMIAENVATKKILDGHNWRIVQLDTVLPEHHSGYLSGDELAFLDKTLGESGDYHVLIAMHHHPVSVNSPWMDTMILENPSDFFAVVDHYPAVKGIIWGHIHQEFSRHRNTIRLLGSPSTCRQFILETDTSTADDKPPGYRRIRLHGDGGITSEVQWLPD